MAKKWYKSRTLWSQAIATAVVILGLEDTFDPEAQAAILFIISVVLRVITKEPLEF